MEDMKRAVINPGFFIGILGLTVMLMRTVWYFKDMPGRVPVMEICSYPMALSGFTVFSAAFPAWGYANQFYKEEKTGYIRFILSRMSWKKFSYTFPARAAKLGLLQRWGVSRIPSSSEISL